MSGLDDLVGLMVKSSCEADTKDQPAPKKNRIDDIHYNKEFGQWVAWSVDEHGQGEHLIGGTEDALRRRIMSLT